VYNDVCLVFAPEYDIAFFGGDPDNYGYPRYCLDAALFRVYENGRPLHVEHYLQWSAAGARPGELVFVSGHPTTTQRLYTRAHWEYLREVTLPALIRQYARERDFVRRFAGTDPERIRQSKDDLWGAENEFKCYTGQRNGLRSPGMMAKKKGQEAETRRLVAADPRLQQAYGDAWDMIAGSRAQAAGIEPLVTFVDQGLALRSRLFSLARAIVRLGERQAAGQVASPAAIRSIVASRPLYPDYERAKAADSLAFAREELGAQHPFVLEILAGKTPEARAAELVNGTKLGDPAFRQALVEGGPDAIAHSSDPMIVTARTVEARAREVRARYESEVLSVERAAYGKIAQAMFALHGTSLHPDATASLRLAYGVVRGYRENGRVVPPFTTYGGLFRRSALYRARAPFELPRRWRERQARLDLQTPLDFASTADISGGNSGSPVVNAKGELVGLIFDGNIQSLGGRFMYDDSQVRAVSVDSRGILEALSRVYDAPDLAAELRNGRR
jgi:hypothetical protein